MATEPEEQPTIRRGKGLRLSTGPAPTGEAAPTPPAPEPSAADMPPQPVVRRRGLRLSTQAPPEPAADQASPAKAPEDDLAITVLDPTTKAPVAPPPEPESAGERFRIGTARGPISYVQAGEGPPLLLVHGWGASARIWGGTLPALARLRTLYAFDLPGSGESPQRLTAPTLETLADEIIASANALGLWRFDLLGHALGAAVAAQLAARHPDRISHLVLTSLGVRPFAPQLAALGLARPTLDLSLGLARPLFDLWKPFNRTLWQSPPLAVTVRAMMLYGSPADNELWQSYLADHAASDPRAYVTSLTAPADPTLHEALRSTRATTLCLTGRDDRVSPLAEATSAQTLVANSKLVILDACGHLPMIEQPEAFHAEVRRFLEQ